MYIKAAAEVFFELSTVCSFHSCHCEFLFSTENAAEKELWRENTDYKDQGEFIFIQLSFPQ